MRTRALGTFLLLALSACGARAHTRSTSEPAHTSTTTTQASSATGFACSLEGNVLRQRSNSACAESLWRLTPTAEGQWSAAEEGCANATGSARVVGSDLVLDITYDGGAARYTWTLDSACTGTGRLEFTAGPFTGQTYQSELSPAQ